MGARCCWLDHDAALNYEVIGGAQNSNLVTEHKIIRFVVIIKLMI